jgi:hypothetical protein
VMNTPDQLPLSGAPRLTVIGREVALPTSGYADVIAVEPDGRPVIRRPCWLFGSLSRRRHFL